MKIIEKKIFSDFITSFLFCVLFLYVLFVIGDIFGFLDEILREHIGAKALLSFYFYMLPFAITQIAPISCLLSSVFILGNLNKHSEIVALKASGLSLLSIILPIIVGSLIIGSFIFFINERFVPQAMRTANKIRYENLESGKKGSSKIIKDVAIYGQGNKFIFAKIFDLENNSLREVIIHAVNQNQKTIEKIAVESMTWTGDRWAGKGVVTYYISENGEFLGTPDMADEKEVGISETPLDFINNQWQPQYMSFMKLKKYLSVFLAGSKLAHTRFSVDLYYKLSFPFSCLAMIMISAPFAVTTRRGGALLGMAKGILVGLIYIPAVAVCMALGKGGTLSPFLAAWLANIIFILGGLFLTIKN